MNRRERRAVATAQRRGRPVADGSPAVGAEISAARTHHQAGRLAEAERLYAAILARQPEHAEALRLQSIIAFQQDDAGRAAALATQAIAVAPDYAEAHYTMGVAQRALGNAEAALASYRKAVKLRPDFAEAHNNLGTVLNDLGKAEAAFVAFRRALELRPDFSEAHDNLGSALLARGRLADAAAAYKKALAIEPDNVETLNNLGNALRGLGDLPAAVETFRKALGLAPDFVAAHSNLGGALNDQGRPDEAFDAYRAALALAPDDAVVHSNLGTALIYQGKLDEAEAAFRQALALAPDFADAHNNLGNALRDKRQWRDAVAAYRSALALAPDFAAAHNNLGGALKDQGRLAEAIAAYRASIAHKPDFTAAHSNLVFSMNYDAAATQQTIFAESLAWHATHAASLGRRAAGHANAPDPERRLRVGYVSPDFREHSVAYFLEPLIAAHDRAAFEVFCYAHVARPDQRTERFRGLADTWRSTVGMTDADLATAVRADGIDILVDLAGHTGGNRLLAFARRPAPLQLSWLGYPNTTGTEAIDARLTDAIADPPGSGDALHSETLVRLPNGFLCYAPPADAPAIGGPPARSAGHVTFGSFNALAKITPAVVAAWARILLGAPGSRMVMKSGPLADQATRARYLELFAAAGVDAGRVDLRAWIEARTGHLGAYQAIDIALDPFPYNGTTTTCEALWMGVPVVTLAGDRHAGRVGASLLTRIGLAELVAETTDGYVETAVRLAGDLDGLPARRLALRDRMMLSPLCDAAGFARDVEAAYRAMWRRWCAGR